MKNILQLPLLLLFVLFAVCLRAGDAPAQGTYTVIAKSGLKLRSAANADAGLVAAIPFGTRVQLADTCRYSADTVSAVRDYYSFVDPSTHERVYEDRAITGRWVRVNFDGEIGFVFDAYLWAGELKHYANDRHQLLYPAETDVTDVLYHPAVFNYYGIYRQGDSDTYRVLPIEVEYYAYHSEDGVFDELRLVAQENRDLQFIVGSQQKIRAHTFAGSYFTDAAATVIVDPDYPGADYELTPFPTEFTFQNGQSPKSGAVVNKVLLTRRDWTQTVLTEHSVATFQLQGMGDIDGDGQADFLLHTYGEKKSTARLYLSSLAEEGEWVGLATEVFFPLGC